MRYVFGFLCVCALGVVALSQSVSAQAGEDDPLSGEPAPTSEPAPEEPALAVPDIDTLSQRTIERYEIQSAQRTEEKKKHGRRRRIGLGVGISVAIVVVGLAVGGAVWAKNFELD